MCHLLQFRYVAQLTDNRPWGALSQVHLQHRHPLSQWVVPAAKDPSNPQVKTGHINPRLQLQRERVRGWTI